MCTQGHWKSENKLFSSLNRLYFWACGLGLFLVKLRYNLYKVLSVAPLWGRFREYTVLASSSDKCFGLHRLCAWPIFVQNFCWAVLNMLFQYVSWLWCVNAILNKDIHDKKVKLIPLIPLIPALSFWTCICPFLLRLFLPKFTIKVTILILKMLLFPF